MLIAVATTLVASLLASSGCAALRAPVEGPIQRGFAPVGLYGGHWGADFGASAGTVVLAAAGGRISFAGSVAGRLSVTVDHGGGLRTSYSYLSNILVQAGSAVGEGEPVGTAGPAHGDELVHLSVRIGDRYHDPAKWLSCLRSPRAGLRLAPVYGRAVYPRRRATRHSRRDVRSSSSCPSARGRHRPL